MIGILDRYIGRTVAAATLLALGAVAALDTVVGLMGELARVDAAYPPAAALRHVLLGLPGEAVALMPLALLLGTLMGLGALAARSELVVMRAAGISVPRIGASVMVAALPLAAAAAVLGEWVVPQTERLARATRAHAESLGIMYSESGFWARAGGHFVHVQRILPGGRLVGVTVYETDEEGLRRVRTARLATLEEGAWVLHDVRTTDFGEGTVGARDAARVQAPALLDPETARVLATPPEELSVRGLLRYRAYLRANGLDARRYEAALWAKLLSPLTNLLIVALAVPFVFGPLRSSSAGARLAAGIFLGIAVHLGARLSEQAGHAFGWPPVLGAALPAAVLALAVGVAFRAVR
ncbi:LPS export ABC transporter permease LptG [Inmirania thermothiophila]|uniref:Lipopolysaccharide export system permease protein n=1 Tax=Inmirania thermothiophila TaxID=1750597 RepID=A0A3N1Y246_9GAMM|nr:LPS export ABC transporter permease LptG [Inmirania thermothiophila]ROR32889.1 lipopolysaccharide export system permease protein [Inmirania thermothiophila]